MVRAILIPCDVSEAIRMIDVVDEYDVPSIDVDRAGHIHVEEHGIMFYGISASEPDAGLSSNIRASALWWLWRRRVRVRLGLLGDVLVTGNSPNTDEVLDVPEGVRTWLTEPGLYQAEFLAKGDVTWMAQAKGFRSYVDAAAWSMSYLFEMQAHLEDIRVQAVPLSRA